MLNMKPFSGIRGENYCQTSRIALSNRKKVTRCKHLYVKKARQFSMKTVLARRAGLFETFLGEGEEDGRRMA